MNRVDIGNCVAVVGALIAALCLAAAQDRQPPAAHDAAAIASASVLADELLIEMGAFDRVVAVTRYSQTERTDKNKYASKKAIGSIDDTESILQLGADLVVVHGVGDPRPVARLIEAGIEVLDLGAVGGLQSLLEDVRVLAERLGLEDNGAKLADELSSQMDAVTPEIAPHQQRAGMFLTVVGTTVYGGTKGTGFHDILRFAGLRDLAAQAYLGSPSYRPEQLLKINPPLVITNEGGAARLCALSALANLSVCSDRSAIIEVDNELLSTSGLNMPEAARVIRNAVYGPAH